VKNKVCSLSFRIASLCVLFIWAHANANSTLSTELTNQLTLIASGRDSAFGIRIAPAAGPAAIERITSEIDVVTSAFQAAPSAQKIAAAKATIARFSAETARDGASRSFEGRSPSLSIMRQVLFIPKASAVSSSKVIEIVSQFERSPKPDDHYYEYSDPKDLKSSTIIDMPGSPSSWISNARPAMVPGKVYGLKKCRHLFVLGWYCNTALYEVRNLSREHETLITFLRPLVGSEDNSVFDDDRGKNVVDGYTAVYVIVLSGDLVLAYSVGIQSRAEPPGQQAMLNEGHKQEYRQLVGRLEGVLGIPALPF
jgi:hypothetical protein